MAKFEFKLPDIGEGVTEGEIVNWLVEVEETVSEDQDLVEVMTDKATVTIGAPRAGRVVELRGKPGDVVPVGSVLAVFEVGAESAENGAPPRVAQPPGAPPAQRAPEGGGPVGDIKEELPGTGAPAGAPGRAAAPPSQPSPPAAAAPGAADYFSEKPLAAPATRRLARELGVDLRRVAPTGKAGRVTAEDVERAASQAEPTSGRDAGAGEPAKAPAAPVAAHPDEERIPIRGLRRRIFENMARSKRTAAHFTYVDECDVTSLKELRERAKAIAEADGVHLTFLPFIVKAVVAALIQHPELNALVDDAKQEIVRRRSYDIGIATATEAGLIVPVLRGADRRSIVGIAREIERLAVASREGKVQAADLGGSSFTITSLGKQGGLFATPVVNYPEVAILGVHEIKRRPVVRNEQVVVGDVMLLSLSFDHRIIDGHVGAAFAQTIIRLLEQPDRLLISMT